MKFCSKCGTEMMDDVNFCPNCGFAISGTKRNDKNKKYILGNILNHIAVIFYVVLSIFVFDTINSQYEGTSSTAGVSVRIVYEDGPNLAFWLWISIFILIWCMGLFIYKFKNKKISQVISYLYLICSVICAVIMVEVPRLDVIMCFMGVFVFVPVILQIIAGICFIVGYYE